MTAATTLETGRPFLVMQDLVRLLVTAEQTGGSFFAMEVDVAPGGGPPPLHTHDAAELFWTLRGRLSYFRQEDDGEVTEITGGPGTWAFIPGGVPHTYRNFSDGPGAYLAVLSARADAGLPARRRCRAGELASLAGGGARPRPRDRDGDPRRRAGAARRRRLVTACNVTEGGAGGAGAAPGAPQSGSRVACVTFELRLLRTFVVVAEELHFGNAAARLYISQPALSQQIKALEEQVGLPLFVRGPRGVTLTPAGETLLDDAREVLERSQRLGESVEQLRRGASGTLKLGVAPGVPGRLLPELVSSLRACEPDARIVVRELATPEQLAALGDGSLDLGLVREPIDDPGVARRCLLVELLGVSLPVGHPLAARESVSLRDLEGESFVCFPRQWAPSLHDVLVRAMLEAGVDAEYQQSEHVSTTQGMVAAGLALTFSAPPWLEGVEGITWRPIADARIEIRTAAAWRAANRSPLLQRLVALLPAEPGGDVTPSRGPDDLQEAPATA